MKETKYTHTSGSDGLELSALRMEPDKKEDIKGVLQLVHGMCEHKERYIPFMEYMTSHGFVTVIHDNRGHGGSVRSPEDLGYMYENGAEALVEDIHEITMDTKLYLEEELELEDLPFTLLGHSMGSLAVRCYIQKYDKDIDKLIVVGCPSKLSGMDAGLAFIKLLEAQKGDHARSKAADKLVMGANNRKFKDEGPSAWVCSDKVVVEEYLADPLCSFSFTLNGYENLIKLMKQTYSDHEASNTALPIRFYSGAEDPCAVSRRDLALAIRHLTKQGYTDVKGRMYPGMRHEILNEKKKAYVWKDILKFIEAPAPEAQKGEKEATETLGEKEE